MSIHKEQFKRAIALLQKHPDSVACIAFGRIAGWNYAFEKTPLIVTEIWNANLPKKIHVGNDAFIDKGETPEWLTRSEKLEIQDYEGVPKDPHHKRFEPYYEWSFPRPIQSPRFLLECDRKSEILRKQQEERKSRNMPMERYWGD